jgi:hypothetical protein
MPPSRYTGPPIDLANMRANGVRSLAMSCRLSPSGLPDAK